MERRTEERRVGAGDEQGLQLRGIRTGSEQEGTDTGREGHLND